MNLFDGLLSVPNLPLTYASTLCHEDRFNWEGALCRANKTTDEVLPHDGLLSRVPINPHLLGGYIGRIQSGLSEFYGGRLTAQ